jgi:hypothetical protein
MKRIVVFVVFVALTINCTYTLKHYANYRELRLIAISERVGEVIDAEEREQFDLFPSVTDFNSATFYEIVDGGYKVEIMAADKILAAVNRDSQAVEILRDYVDRYEEIQGSREVFVRKWKIIDYDVLGQPITSNEMQSIRRNSYSCGFGVGSFLVGLIPNFLLSFVAIGGLTIDMFGTSGSGLARPVPAWISFLVINIGATGAGALFGKRFDGNAALNAIKEARLPEKLQNDQ